MRRRLGGDGTARSVSVHSGWRAFEHRLKKPDGLENAEITCIIYYTSNINELESIVPTGAMAKPPATRSIPAGV